MKIQPDTQVFQTAGKQENRVATGVPVNKLTAQKGAPSAATRVTAFGLLIGHRAGMGKRRPPGLQINPKDQSDPCAKWTSSYAIHSESQAGCRIPTGGRGLSFTSTAAAVAGLRRDLLWACTDSQQAR